MTDETPEASTTVEAPAEPTAPADDHPQVEWPEGYVDQVRSAEAAHQRSILNFPTGPMPPELERAIERRVEVNLSQADGKTVRRVGHTDTEVQDLERPYLQRRSPTTPTTEPRGRRQRPAKKTAATPAATTQEGIS